MDKNQDRIERHDGLEPGEGPSAERFRPESLHEGGGGGPAGSTIDRGKLTGEPGHHEGEVLNQDGSRLDAMPSWGGGNPTGPFGRKLHHGEYEVPGPKDLVVGGETGVLAEDGQRREQIPGIAGGPGTSDLGTSGHLGGDASNIGGNGDENF